MKKGGGSLTSASIVNFEQVNVGWELHHILIEIRF